MGFLIESILCTLLTSCYFLLLLERLAGLIRFGMRKFGIRPRQNEKDKVIRIPRILMGIGILKFLFKISSVYDTKSENH